MPGRSLDQAVGSGFAAGTAVAGEDVFNTGIYDAYGRPDGYLIRHLAPIWEQVLDLLRWAGYRWSQREELQASDAWWAVLAGLVVILGWRLLRGKRVLRPSGAAGAARRYPGMDSEFYALTKALAPREDGETLSAWLRRVAPGKYDKALGLHQRYRFDPLGLSQGERARLRELCRAAIAAPS